MTVNRENKMNTDRFQIITPSNRQDYRDLVRGLTKAAWPEFMLHDAVASEYWHELLDRFADYQLALYDKEDQRVAAMGNSFPMEWEASLDDLPEDGWDWAFVEAVNQHKQNRSPNMQCAIQVVIRDEYQGQGLSTEMLQALHGIGESKGFKQLIVPVRPNEKSKYPLISIDDYITWKTAEGLPFDAWLRVHARLGGKIIKTCHESKTIRGTRAEWEEWTRLKFPQSGQYIIPDALKPIEMNIEEDKGVYIEPNVWMAHTIEQRLNI
jgi:GNAT superfamily N-acetyltransferase